MLPDPAGCGGGSGGAGHPIRPSESLESIESAVAYRVSANTKTQRPGTPGMTPGGDGVRLSRVHRSGRDMT